MTEETDKKEGFSRRELLTGSGRGAVLAGAIAASGGGAAILATSTPALAASYA